MMGGAALPVSPALPRPAPLAARDPRMRTAAWVFAVWLAFMHGIDPRVLMPWIMPAGRGDVTVRALTGAALTLGVFALARRFPFDRRRLARWLAIHAAGAVVFVLASVGVVFSFHLAMNPALDPRVRWDDAVLSSQHWHFMLYWILLGIGLALGDAERVRERERAAAELRLAASRLEAEFARARLDALRMQMQPHFLFNTLNAISELIHQDARLAVRMIGQLGDLLRLTLESTEAREVPLEQELAVLDRYLAIQRTRFGDRLETEVRVDDDARRVRVPSLLLQPLVENALNHGVPPEGTRQRVTVSARRDGDALRIEVRDNGPGAAPLLGTRRTGVGLRNVRARLEHLYGERASFELVDADGGGAVARVVVPWE